MKVFCDRDRCRFNLNHECRTSAISVSAGECSTFELQEGAGSDSGGVTFWGHLSIEPPIGDPSARPGLDGTARD